ncbi:MAG TPA: hypothetical protein VF498_17430, partial [Anaerolineales bacterium]
LRSGLPGGPPAPAAAGPAAAARGQAGRQVRVWYLRGGGEAGNLAARKLDTLVRLPVGPLYAAVLVTNPLAARGGLEAESLANALVRGPREVFSLESVVKARDYEQAAIKSSRALARAKAYPGFGLWTHAKPGTVELVLIPTLPAEQLNPVVLETLQQNEDDRELVDLQTALMPRIPIGTRLQPVWARYKQVKVIADLIVSDLENVDEMGQRVENRLYSLISPLPGSSGPHASSAQSGPYLRPYRAASLSKDAEAATMLAVDTTRQLTVGQYIIVQDQPCRILDILENQITVDTPVSAKAGALIIASKAYHAGTGATDPNTERMLQSGWPFGQQLRVADIYRLLLATENINLISRLSLALEDAPDENVYALAADIFQPNTWYAGSGARLFRSMDDGKGWELLVAFERLGNRLFDLDESQKPAVWNQRQDMREEIVASICPSPNQAGLVAVTTLLNPGLQERSALYISTDCGESWYCQFREMDAVEDMAWMPRGASLILLLATRKGLFEMELALDEDGNPTRPSDPMPVPVDPSQPAMPLYAVTVISGISGHNRVAVAAQARGGVYLSSSADLLPIHDRMVSSGAQTSPV